MMDEVTLSEEERLLQPDKNEKERKSRLNIGSSTPSKLNRNKLADANRSNSMLSLTDAANKITLVGQTTTMNSSSSDLSTAAGGNASTTQQIERAASLSDVRSLLQSNWQSVMPNDLQEGALRSGMGSVDSAPPGASRPSHQSTPKGNNLRPPLASNLGADGKPKRKKHRAGKKLQEARKRKEERAIAQQNNTTAGNADMIAQSESLQAALNIGVQPDAAQNRWRQGLQGSQNAKRGRAHGGTPPDGTQLNKKKRQSTQNRIPQVASTSAIPPTASVVAQANLTVAIVDQPAPNVILPMDKAKYDKLFVAINRILFCQIENGIEVPTFTDNKHTRGAMKICRSNPGAKSWLQQAVQYIPAEWPGMSLKAIDFSQLPQQKKVLGLFTHCEFTDIQIKMMLKACNPRINPNCWTQTSFRRSDRGTHIAYSIDDIQFEILAASNFKLHFGAGYALFKDISKKSGGNARSAAEMETDHTTDGMVTETDGEDNITVITNNTIVPQVPATAQSAANLSVPIASSTTPLAPTGTNVIIDSEMKEVIADIKTANTPSTGNQITAPNAGAANTEHGNLNAGPASHPSC